MKYVEVKCVTVAERPGVETRSHCVVEFSYIYEAVYLHSKGGVVS